MMELDDPRWTELPDALGDAGGVPALLRRLRATPDDRTVWDDAYTRLCHRGRSPMSFVWRRTRLRVGVVSIAADDAVRDAVVTVPR
jgi:hypothetical protein